jgi:hypothetical protein
MLLLTSAKPLRGMPAAAFGSSDLTAPTGGILRACAACAAACAACSACSCEATACAGADADANVAGDAGRLCVGVPGADGAAETLLEPTPRQRCARRDAATRQHCARKRKRT